MTPEGKIKALIISVLVKHKAWYFMPVPTGFQAKTIDFFACHRGKFIAIEAKAEGKKATPRQEHVLKMIQAAGGITFVIDNPDLIDVLDRTLEEMNP